MITSLAIDGKNKWIGTAGGGLIKFDEVLGRCIIKIIQVCHQLC